MYNFRLKTIIQTFLNMKLFNFIAIFIALVTFISCGTSPTEPKPEPLPKVGSYEVITLDGCEYLKYSWPTQRDHVLTHKGNCSNPIHKCPCK